MPAILALGFAGFTVYQIGLAYGEVTVNAGTASLLIASAPIFTALVAAVAFRERLKALGWIAIAVSVAGVSLIVWGSGKGFRIATGALLILLSALSESLYFVFQKPYLEKYRPIELTAYTIWAGTGFMLVFAPGLGAAIQQAPLSETLAVVYLGILPWLVCRPL